MVVKLVANAITKFYVTYYFNRIYWYHESHNMTGGRLGLEEGDVLARPVEGPDGPGLFRSSLETVTVLNAFAILEDREKRACLS